MNKDAVRITDYKRFLVECYLPWLVDEDQKLQALYAARKEEYENKRLPKLFGWKFENSYEGDTSWMGSWNLKHYSKMISKVEKELLRLLYLVKTNNEKVNMHIDLYDDFYRWCDKNNIPF